MNKTERVSPSAPQLSCKTHLILGDFFSCDSPIHHSCLTGGTNYRGGNKLQAFVGLCLEPSLRGISAPDQAFDLHRLGRLHKKQGSRYTCLFHWFRWPGLCRLSWWLCSLDYNQTFLSTAANTVWAGCTLHGWTGPHTSLKWEQLHMPWCMTRAPASFQFASPMTSLECGGIAFCCGCSKRIWLPSKIGPSGCWRSV